jgi:hypothetical protein
VFTAVPGAVVTASPPFSGLVTIGTITSGIVTGLFIPVTAQTRLVFVISATAEGVTLVNAVSLENVSLGVGIS